MLGEDSESLIYTLKNLGICMQALNQPDSAEEYYRQAKDIIEKNHDRR